MNQAAASAVCRDHLLEFLKGKLPAASGPRLVALGLFAIVSALYWRMR